MAERTYSTQVPERIAVELPLTCPCCRAEVTKRSQLKVVKGYSGKAYVSHEPMGCWFEVKDLPRTFDAGQETLELEVSE